MINLEEGQYLGGGKKVILEGKKKDKCDQVYICIPRIHKKKFKKRLKKA